METAKTTKAGRTGLLLMLGAAAAGLLNGILGTGGGIILVMLFTRLAQSGRLPWQEEDRLGGAVCIMLPVTVLSAGLSALLGGGSPADEGMLCRLLLPGAAGSAIGCALEGRIRAAWLKRLFAAATLTGGAWMLADALTGGIR